ncbi:MAG: TonB family protein [Caulobacteraceae bacterium]|nr:TonB family protein [Caulobacteraceae bacterium]
MGAWRVARMFAAAALIGAPMRVPAEPATPPAQAPPRYDILAYYPPAAKSGGVSGSATLSCGLTEHGGFTGCNLVSEDPAGHGFGAAALAMAAKAVGDQGVELPPDRRGPETVTFRFTASPLSIQPDVLNHRPAVITHPDWVHQPSADDVTEYYPAAAVRTSMGGRAILECGVGIDELLEYCVVREETPEGYGFGDAALRLSHLFKMRPMTRDGVPVAGAKVVIPIHFQMPPDVVPAPLPDELLLAYYPAAARAARISGSATVSCERTEHGGLTGCSLVSEAPAAHDFGQAALAIAAKAVEGQELAPSDRGPMKITFSFQAAPPDIHPDVLRQGWAFVRPDWVRLPTLDAGNYPRAALRARVGGVATMKCKVGGGGELKDCAVVGETPPDMGFGAALLKLSSRFRMKAVTDDGIWTDGLSVVIPIDFSLPRS